MKQPQRPFTEPDSLPFLSLDIVQHALHTAGCIGSVIIVININIIIIININIGH